MINLTKKLRVAEIERKDNPSMMEDTEFIFLNKVRPKITGSNIFSMCKRVHIEHCEITYMEIDGDLVAFVTPKG